MEDYQWSMSELIKVIKDTQRVDKDYIIVVDGATGCQPKGSKVLMANGSFKNIEDIRKGDLILSPQKDGTNIFSKVLNTTKWKCKNNYLVREQNRKKRILYRCSNNHIIPFYNRFIPRINGQRNSKDAIWQVKEKTAEEYEKYSKELNCHRRIGFSSFLIKNFKDKKNCKIEPYSLGIYLGDGYFSRYTRKVLNKKYNEMKSPFKKLYHKISYSVLSIETPDIEVINEIKKTYPLMSIYDSKNSKSNSYNFSINSEFAILLEKYNLCNKKSGDKFIPLEALTSDSEYRKKLLAGLIDSDGYYQKGKGGYNIISKSKKLIEDIHFLVYSLGGRASIRKVKKRIKKLNFEGEYYEMNFYLHNLKLPIKCKRKIKDVNSVYLASNRIGFSTEKDQGTKKVYGFELDSPSKWYITDNWIITHNSGKSTIAAKLCIRGDENFKIEEGIIFSRDEFINTITTSPSGRFYSSDEAINVLFKRDFATKKQKLLLRLLDMCRDKNLCLILCVPNFWSLDKHILEGRVKLRIHVARTGLAFLWKPSDNPFTPDKWYRKFNEKVCVNWDQYPNAKKTRGFIGTLKFGDLTEGYKERYLKVKAHKKELMRVQEQNEENKDKIEKQRGINLGEVQTLHFLKENGLLPAGSITKLAAKKGQHPSSIYGRIKTYKKNLKETGEVNSLLLGNRKDGNKDLYNNLNNINDLIQPIEEINHSAI